ncbi:heavy metal-associated domain-containing protein [Mycobacterium sp. CVI_P3]|uniref:Heavy metal-associated domain-containing protein n=1 Tax=Mycobacterium pinniadriaticum TaxID=2994102 RepID=A0ABT3SJW6_9MYCO|nr:heavy metal-associated domain-containing protein [Mycobacterium pinniadriaticum]MCX2933406.1 heavy metal-associated domain-containing protein [Mycobacterium pinniadriaticum]MCX2939828.1 heavy metal-associated domain-containing protein [Mycobacterium pinniadriaticum]
MTVTEVFEGQDRRIQLDVTGMTCRMCASHIAKRLNKVDGVRASVDLTTRIATVDARADVDVAELCDVVRKAGYGATERLAGAGDVVSPIDAGVRGPVRQLIEFALMFLGWLGIRRR